MLSKQVMIQFFVSFFFFFLSFFRFTNILQHSIRHFRLQSLQGLTLEENRREG